MDLAAPSRDTRTPAQNLINVRIIELPNDATNPPPLPPQKLLNAY